MHLSLCRGVQTLTKALDSLGLTTEEVATLFTEWFFSAPLGLLLSTPSFASASGLRRWMGAYVFGAATDGSHGGGYNDGDDGDGDGARRSMQSAIYEACDSTPHMEHALLLCLFCKGACSKGWWCAGCGAATTTILLLTVALPTTRAWVKQDHPYGCGGR